MAKMKFKQWLYTPCEQSELMELEKGIYYMPITVVKSKIDFMRNEYGAKINFHGFNHIFHNTSKQTIASGSIGVTIIHEDINQSLVGAASFFTDIYMPNYHFAATLKSLSIVNAFSNEYPQFGSLLNLSKAVDQVNANIGNNQKPMADVLMQKKMSIAIAANDQEAIDQLLQNYQFKK